MPIRFFQPLRAFSSQHYRDAVDLLDKIQTLEPKISPEVKKLTKIDIPEFMERKQEISEALTFKHTPNKFMKYMDTSMEKFFYQRDYNKKNFNFYLQILSSQYKIEEAEKAIERMKILGIEPDLETYNHLATLYAKQGDVDTVEEIMELGKG